MHSFCRHAERLAVGLLLAALSAAPQAAAEAGRQKAVTVYARDVAFCRRLVRELDQVKVIEPVLTSPKVWRIVDTRDTSDAQGQWYVPANRYYFIDVTLKDPGPDLGQMLRRPDWRQRLFRPGGTLPPTEAQARLGMKLIYDPTGRWRALERRFPGFLLAKVNDLYGRVTQAPKWFALYLFDFDGDGKTEHILHRQYEGPGGMKAYFGFDLFDQFDLDTGGTKRLVEQLDTSFTDYVLRPALYRGQAYIVGRSVSTFWFGEIPGRLPRHRRSRTQCLLTGIKALRSIGRRKLTVKKLR